MTFASVNNYFSAPKVVLHFCRPQQDPKDESAVRQHSNGVTKVHAGHHDTHLQKHLWCCLPCRQPVMGCAPPSYLPVPSSLSLHPILPRDSIMIASVIASWGVGGGSAIPGQFVKTRRTLMEDHCPTSVSVRDQNEHLFALVGGFGNATSENHHSL